MTGFLGFGKQELENCWSLDNRGRGHLFMRRVLLSPTNKTQSFTILKRAPRIARRLFARSLFKFNMRSIVVGGG